MATYGLPAWPWSGATVEDLPGPERLVLDGLRLWAEACRAGRPPLPRIRPPFVAEDAPGGAPPLDLLLRGAAAVRPLDFGDPLHPRVLPEEATVLLACALAQRGARREALATWLRWLSPPLAAYAAMSPAITLGAALRSAGLLLRHPLREAARGGGGR